MDELIQSLIESGTLRTRSIIKAFRRIDRADFVRPEDAPAAYADEALPIGHGQTISQPTVVAFMLELLQPKEGDSILDVGSGSGWTTALLGQMVGANGEVRGVEIVPELVEFGQRNLVKYDCPNVEIVQAHENELGLPEDAPFDKILISAAAEEVPRRLLDQLANGGRMVVPVGNDVWLFKKSATGEFENKKFEGFAFVPLLNKENE
ncbi:MAG: protein-L-isoaspartate O-methyltransferase [Patescibacteria group bacterium]|nr:protein-L-isoaspartate O-methyltransferase [Patescibacteria group bacterium]